MAELLTAERGASHYLAEHVATGSAADEIAQFDEIADAHDTLSYVTRWKRPNDRMIFLRATEGAAQRALDCGDLSGVRQRADTLRHHARELFEYALSPIFIETFPEFFAHRIEWTCEALIALSARHRLLQGAVDYELDNA